MGLVQQARRDGVTVLWPVLYAGTEPVGQGTVLNVSDHECLVAGTMPVTAGMLLKLWISAGSRQDALYVKQARVLWAAGAEFGLEMQNVDANDHQWLLRYLHQR